MKLLALCSSPTRTGATALLSQLLRELSRRGLEVRLYHDRFREGDLGDWCASVGLETGAGLSLSTVAPPHHYPRDLWRLSRLLRRGDWSAVLTAETNDLLLAAAARRLAFWPGRILAYAPRPPRPALRTLADAWLLPGALAPSEWGLGNRPCLHTGPVVDRERFRPPAAMQTQQARQFFGFSPSDIVVGWVGRFKPGRGVTALLKAFASCTPDIPRLRLLLVGFGETLPLARWWVQQAGLSGRVCFAGFQREGLPRCYHAMNGLLLPVIGRDGLGRAALEALACGCGVGLVRHPAWEGWAKDMRGVFHLDATNPAGLASAMRRIAADPLPPIPGEAGGWLAVESDRALDGLMRWFGVAHPGDQRPGDPACSKASS